MEINNIRQLTENDVPEILKGMSSWYLRYDTNKSDSAEKFIYNLRLDLIDNLKTRKEYYLILRNDKPTVLARVVKINKNTFELSGGLVDLSYKGRPVLSKSISMVEDYILNQFSINKNFIISVLKKHYNFKPLTYIYFKCGYKIYKEDSEKIYLKKKIKRL